MGTGVNGTAGQELKELYWTVTLHLSAECLSVSRKAAAD